MSSQHPPIFDSESIARARTAAHPMRDTLGVADLVAPYESARWRGGRSGPVLHLEDISAIPFVSEVPGIEEYQHRARVRATTGELYAAVSEPVTGYEDYCRDTLRMGSPELLRCAPERSPLSVARACGKGQALTRLAEVASRAGGLLVHPYMAFEDVFELAARIAIEAKTRVEVVGPPPPVNWIANDKAHFSEIAARTLGDDWVVETRIAHDPEHIARYLLEIGTRHRRVGVKRTRCASAMGNCVFVTSELARLSPPEVEAAVLRFLHRTEWTVGEDVLIVAWEETDLSPSTQLWIPPLDQGPPILEGIYEQILAGDHKVFVGSRPSTLPAPLNARMGKASVLVAAALQELGYVGRCSFDLLVVGDPLGEPDVRFMECNGRWGGTSTPMHLVDRLTGPPRPTYRAQDFDHPELTGADLPDLLAALGDDLFDPATGRGRFVLYNVGPLTRRGKLDVIAFGRTPEEADEALLMHLPRRLGLR